jgi:hypothetical protein
MDYYKLTENVAHLIANEEKYNPDDDNPVQDA